MRKTVVIAVAIVAISASVLLASQGATAWSVAATLDAAQSMTPDHQDVLTALRRLERAQLNQDTATFHRLTADEFVHRGTSGALSSKREWLRAVEDAEKPSTTRQAPLDASATPAPGMVIHIAGTTAVVVTPSASDTDGQQGRVVTVLVKRGAEWQQLLVNRQVARGAVHQQ